MATTSSGGLSGDGWSRAWAAARVWSYLAIDAYERHVLIQGWSQQRYSNWLAHTMVSALQ